jgi:hypothetical protein
MSRYREAFAVRSDQVPLVVTDVGEFLLRCLRHEAILNAVDSRDADDAK